LSELFFTNMQKSFSPFRNLIKPAFVLWACIAALACMLPYVSPAEAALQGAISRAESYYKGRRDLENVQKALAILRSHISSHPQDYEAWWRISEYDCYLARHVPDEQQKAILEDGIVAGQKAEAIDPHRPEGHFWTGANEGLLAEDVGLLKGLRMVDSIRQELETVMKIDPNYQQYGAERLLGRFYYRAPFFKGGDKQRSVQLLEDCLKRYPDNSLTMLYLADSYRAVGRREDARRMLERILHMDSEPGYGPELADNQAAAREELQRYFHASR
jgi:tetratricopeptide (TPR) repeat protein